MAIAAASMPSPTNVDSGALILSLARESCSGAADEDEDAEGRGGSVKMMDWTRLKMRRQTANWSD